MQIIDKLHIWQGTEPSAFILLIDFDNLWPLFGTMYINSGYHRDVIWYQNGVIFHLVMPQKLWIALSETAKFTIFASTFLEWIHLQWKGGFHRFCGKHLPTKMENIFPKNLLFPIEILNYKKLGSMCILIILLGFVLFWPQYPLISRLLFDCF